MKNYTYFFLLYSLLSCSPTVENMEIKAEFAGSVEIPLGERVSSEPRSSQYIETDSGEYLAVFNKFLPSIEIYNLNTKKSAKRILLSKDGPNRIGVSNGFQIFSYDTILLASIPPKLMVFNFEGVKTSTISIDASENNVNFLSSTNEIPFLFDGKSIFGAQPFFQNFFTMKSEEVANYKHIYKVKLSSEDMKAEWLPISNPPNIWNDGKKTEDFYWTDRNDTIIVSPQTDHRLWLISKKEGKLLGYKNAKSKYVKNFQIIDKLPEGDRGIIENVASDSYQLIKYDQYRDVFYRLFFVGVNWEDYNISYRDLFSNRPKVGVMVLDKNLRIIGEHIFEDHYMQNWNCFVGKQGLYVSTNNSLRNDFDENYLKYDIIRFAELRYED